MKFCDVLHRVTGTGQKHDQKYLLCSSCFENITLLFADYLFWLLCVSPTAWGMKLKISTVLLNTHRQTTRKKKKKKENEAFLQVSFTTMEILRLYVLYMNMYVGSSTVLSSGGAVILKTLICLYK